MLKRLLTTLSCITAVFMANAQEAEKKFSITGSADVYYRFNFLNAKKQGKINNLTSFTNSHNAFSFGMASVKLEHSGNKIGAVLDLGYGPRTQEFSYNDKNTFIDIFGEEVSSPTLLAAVKQAYVTFAPSDKVKFTMGKFGTHVGYELLDPQLNRNYSMSYMFSYGPFFHTGLKMDINPSENFGFMLGVANPTDLTFADFANKMALAQVHASMADGKVSTYLNYVGGNVAKDISSHQVDLVVTGKISDKFSIGYNGTVKGGNDKTGSSSAKSSFWGSALYLNVDPTEKVGLTLRGEYFDDKKLGTAGVINTSVFAATLSANYKVGGLTIIPELRIDNAKDEIFFKNDGSTTKSSPSFILAGVYSF